ncbi:MAG TPA: Spo0E family sporulation regulatory protein-aspartic acid phosphatase [Clostridiales bacterium]|nr:Spo0E family sporulation regulatory protein-aspartic acid phosphatase [Clostridiales bacterium]
MKKEELKSYIMQVQDALNQLTENRLDITANDILQMSMQLDHLIVEYTKLENLEA